VTARPFRAPHHGISASGLVGGGAVPAPGEVTLAHRGVLFLDELAEFPRPSLEALRQPLEDGTVTIVRAQRALRLPSQVTLVAATNPCPCGGAARDGCRCTDAEIDRYRRRLSGPLLDRMDLLVSVERPAVAAFTGTAGTSSAEVRAEVVAARERQAARLTGTGAHCNAHMSERVTRATAGLDPSAQDALDLAYATSGISARARGRIVRVARTLADLAARDEVTAADVNEALYFRNRLTAGSAVAA
jgi:magnesium chelatase family protein